MRTTEGTKTIKINGNMKLGSLGHYLVKFIIKVRKYFNTSEIWLIMFMLPNLWAAWRAYEDMRLVSSIVEVFRLFSIKQSTFYSAIGLDLYLLSLLNGGRAVYLLTIRWRSSK